MVRFLLQIVDSMDADLAAGGGGDGCKEPRVHIQSKILVIPHRPHTVRVRSPINCDPDCRVGRGAAGRGGFEMKANVV